MLEFLVIFIVFIGVFFLILFVFGRKSNKSEKKTTNRLVKDRDSKYIAELNWLADLLEVNVDILKPILKNITNQYSSFRLKKRKGGFRTISAPNATLLTIQRKINDKILSSVAIHTAAKGFRKNMSVLDNAIPHLGKSNVLKIDLADFFGSISRYKVEQLFLDLNYSKFQTKLLSNLCLLANKLPQGAATSPTISNTISYPMDVKLSKLASDNGLEYTRYADDLTFSGDSIPVSFYNEVKDVITSQYLTIQTNKTRCLSRKDRKIITGISITSGEKLTIPKAKKREIRKNVYYILNKGLADHQRFIQSNDPSYLKRLVGHLNFWLMVEPDNQYVINSLNQLKQVHNTTPSL